MAGRVELGDHALQAVQPLDQLGVTALDVARRLALDGEGPAGLELARLDLVERGEPLPVCDRLQLRLAQEFAGQRPGDHASAPDQTGGGPSDDLVEPAVPEQ